MSLHRAEMCHKKMKRLMGLQGLDFFQFLSCLPAFAPTVPSAGITLSPYPLYLAKAYMSFKRKLNCHVFQDTFPGHPVEIKHHPPDLEYSSYLIPISTYLFSLLQYEVHEKKHFALHFHAHFPSKQAKNKR